MAVAVAVAAKLGCRWGAPDVRSIHCRATYALLLRAAAACLPSAQAKFALPLAGQWLPMVQLGMLLKSGVQH